MQVLWGIGGMLVLLLIAFALSSNRRAIKPRTVIGALAIQVVFGFLVLRWEVGKDILSTASDGVQAVINTANEGIDFLVGPLLPDDGNVFALQVLPIIVFVASLSAVLYYLHILQWVVRIIGGGLQKVLGTSKAESLNATANIFLGQTEAPLLVRPYLAGMTRSELFAVMTGGMATVAGSVLVGYASMGISLENLIAASFMAAPAGLLMAKMLMPEEEEPASDKIVAATTKTDGNEPNEDRGEDSENSDADEDASNAKGAARPEEEPAAGPESLSGKPRNVIDAAATGATDGLKLAMNVGAMLLCFISLIALVNLIIGSIGGLFGMPDITFEQIIGFIFSPLMLLIGVPWEEAVQAGSFLGQKVILNEFVAFADFAPQMEQLSDKTVAIVTFALTGFANLSSMAILLGGLGGLVPSQRPLIAKLGLRAVLGGTLANLMSAAIAGMLVT